MNLDDFSVKVRVIPPLTIAGSVLTSSTVYETAPTAYAGGTTYALGDVASVAGSAGLITVYRSLQSSNTGNTPASSPLWWAFVCETYGAYAGGTTYALADRVIDATNHIEYESLAAGNTGNALTDTTKWLSLGPTNKWAMFDLTTSKATISGSPLTIVITPGRRINSIGLDGLVASSVEITQTVSAVTKFHEVIDLNSREVLNFTQFFFEPFSNQKSVARFNIPPYTNGVITITITASSGNVECAACVIGSYEVLGVAERSARISGLNFSTIERDFDGGINTMTQRRSVPKATMHILTPKTYVNRLIALKDLLDAQPAFWAGIDDDTSGYFDAMQMVGFHRVFDFDLSEEDYAFIDLELEAI